MNSILPRLILSVSKAEFMAEIQLSDNGALSDIYLGRPSVLYRIWESDEIRYSCVAGAVMTLDDSVNVAGMMMNHRLARAMAHAGMAGLLTMLRYKCAWYVAEYVKADRWLPSSKL